MKSVDVVERQAGWLVGPRGSSWQLPAPGVRLLTVGNISHTIRD